jgi:TolB-like protein/Tfp pilus assembly protein PilF
VLPFQNLTGEPSQEFVSDGFTEEMITQLGGLEHNHLSVIARTSSMSFKNTPKTISQIGRELDVQYVVEGSVRSWGDRIRVTAQLVHADDQSHIWAQNYESDRKDILRVQSEIAEAISEQIRLTLSQEERSRLKNASSVDPQMYELCLLGRYEWNKRTEDGLVKSIGYFQQAIARDPAYASAHAGLAEAYLVSAFYSRGSARDFYDKAQAAAERAVQLDKLSFQAHTTLGMVASSYLRHGAAAEFEQALQINPNYATTHHWYAFDLWRTGQHEQALTEIERAMELDPVSPIIGTDQAMFLLSSGQVDQAVSVLKRTLDFAPQFSEAHRSLAIAYVEQGKIPEAAAEARTALELNPNNLGAQATLGYVQAVAGQRDQAQAVLQKLTGAGQGKNAPWYFEAWIYVGLNQWENALDCLDKEYQARTPMMVAITVEPIFRPLSSNPRFQKLLQNIQSGE